MSAGDCDLTSNLNTAVVTRSTSPTFTYGRADVAHYVVQRVLNPRSLEWNGNRWRGEQCLPGQTCTSHFDALLPGRISSTTILE